MTTPRDHQSAPTEWPRRLTTSGAIYSTVPTKRPRINETTLRYDYANGHLAH